ncbi:MAG: hypothetical protein J6Y26_02310 [Lachnospiraceae bacterium]|nr:hypothetical protein [Lachnospiraceae bacterium]
MNDKYLTYAEYQTYGGTLSPANFDNAEFKARKAIDRLTDCRVREMNEVPEAVKRCMFSIISIDSAAGAEAQISNPTVTSFNTDGYSESYGHALSADDATKEITKRITTDLYGEVNDYGVPLLYRGVR